LPSPSVAVVVDDSLADSSRQTLATSSSSNSTDDDEEEEEGEAAPLSLKLKRQLLTRSSTMPILKKRQKQSRQGDNDDDDERSSDYDYDDGESSGDDAANDAADVVDDDELSRIEKDAVRLLATLGRLYDSPLPKSGDTMSVYTYKLSKAVQFRRAVLDDEAEAFGRWGLPVLLYTTSKRTLCTLLSAVLLEKKVVIVCSNLRVLSGFVLALVRLLAPFEYQSPLITAVPASLASLFEAPVPLLAGTPVRPAPEHLRADDIVLYDIASRSLECSAPLPQLPGRASLVQAMAPHVVRLRRTYRHCYGKRDQSLPVRLAKSLSSSVSAHSTSASSLSSPSFKANHFKSSSLAMRAQTFGTPTADIAVDVPTAASSSSSSQAGGNDSNDSGVDGPGIRARRDDDGMPWSIDTLPLTVSDENFLLASRVALVVREHFSSMFSSFRQHVVRDLTDRENPVSTFIDTSFLQQERWTYADIVFFRQFFGTQTFHQYRNDMLYRIDATLSATLRRQTEAAKLH
jgi:DENN (AEX-3) domain